MPWRNRRCEHCYRELFDLRVDNAQLLCKLRDLEIELADCRHGNPGPAVTGTLKFRGAIVANEISITVDATAVADVAWSDSHGNATAAPANVAASVDANGAAAIQADGSVLVTPTGTVGDANVSVSGDGVTSPATGVVHVTAGPAVSGSLSFR